VWVYACGGQSGDIRGTAVLLPQSIELESQACGLIRVDKSILVATMDQQVRDWGHLCLALGSRCRDVFCGMQA
jgi:hypothetical protein